MQSELPGEGLRFSQTCCAIATFGIGNEGHNNKGNHAAGTETKRTPSTKTALLHVWMAFAQHAREDTLRGRERMLGQLAEGSHESNCSPFSIASALGS